VILNPINNNPGGQNEETTKAQKMNSTALGVAVIGWLVAVVCIAGLVYLFTRPKAAGNQFSANAVIGGPTSEGGGGGGGGGGSSARSKPAAAPQAPATTPKPPPKPTDF
jgi:hypothetical protein